MARIALMRRAIRDPRGANARRRSLGAPLDRYGRRHDRTAVPFFTTTSPARAGLVSVWKLRLTIQAQAAEAVECLPPGLEMFDTAFAVTAGSSFFDRSPSETMPTRCLLRLSTGRRRTLMSPMLR